MSAVILPLRKYEELPKRNRVFIERYCLTGDALQSYLDAGYKDGRNAKAKAAQLKSNLRVYIAEKTQELRESVDCQILGLKVLRELAEGAESEAVKLNAAKELLAKTESVLEVHHTHDHQHTIRQMSEEEILARIEKIRNSIVQLEAPYDSGDSTSAA